MTQEDKRNVVDKYKGWMEDLIKEDLKKKSFPFAVLMSQLSGDFNFSSVIRTANFLGASAIYYYGNKRYDKRGAQGAYHYSSVTFLPEFKDIEALKEKYSFVALENNIEEEPVSILNFDWPINSLIILGEEGLGIPKELLKICNHVIEIPNYGSVRSLNVGAAASFAMGSYHSYYNK